MKQIQILMALLMVVTFSIHHKTYAQDKPEVKERIEKEERILKKEVKEEKKEMKEEMKEKREEMKDVKDAHKEEIKEMKQEHKDKIDNMKDANDDDGNVLNDRNEKANNGNAYGKNKEGLTGREFGQARAAEARAHIKNREMELQTAEVKIMNARKRLDAKVQLFEKARQTNEITEEEYVLRKQKIAVAENKLKKAAQSFENNKEVVVVQKKKLSTLFENE